MKNLTQQKIFFPNLDGLRFIAFFGVFFHHSLIVNCFSANHDSVTYKFIFAQKMNGALGVNLFFVLSGFLITYLLLSEKYKYTKINIPNFYMRRLLRIWPMYFSMVLAGFILFPFIKRLAGGIPDETHSWSFYLFFISNFQMILKGFADSSILNVLWSVGVEEQFYIIWPLLLFAIPQRYLGKFFLFFLTATIIFRYFNITDIQVIYYHTLSVIGDMIVGGMTAWLAFNNKNFFRMISELPKKVILSIYILGAMLIIFDYILFVNPCLVLFQRLLYALYFAFIIVEQNFASHSFYKMSNNKFITRWGTYTYGLYCLHTIGLLGTHILSEKILKLQSSWYIMGLDFTVGLGLSMGMAYISYHYFESPFLKLKNKFSYFVK